MVELRKEQQADGKSGNGTLANDKSTVNSGVTASRSGRPLASFPARACTSSTSNNAFLRDSASSVIAPSVSSNDTVAQSSPHHNTRCKAQTTSDQVNSSSSSSAVNSMQHRKDAHPLSPTSSTATSSAVLLSSKSNRLLLCPCGPSTSVSSSTSSSVTPSLLPSASSVSELSYIISSSTVSSLSSSSSSHVVSSLSSATPSSFSSSSANSSSSGTDWYSVLHASNRAVPHTTIAHNITGITAHIPSSHTLSPTSTYTTATSITPPTPIKHQPSTSPSAIASSSLLPSHSNHGDTCRYVDSDAASMYECPICSEMIVSCVESICCGQLFCYACVKEWFTGCNERKNNCIMCQRSFTAEQITDINLIMRPSIAFDRIIANLKIRCNNRTNGCIHITTANMEQNHLLVCEFSAYNCKCQKVILQKDKSIHEQECPNRCKYCHRV